MPVRILLLYWLVLSGLAACSVPQVEKTSPFKPMRVVSVDYCADQYVLKFVPRDRIMAVSQDAVQDFSYMRDRAKGIRKVRSSAEDILALQPDLIVRSYGGGPNASAFFKRAGIPVVQIGWASDFNGVKRIITETSLALGAAEAGHEVVDDMEDRLRQIASQQSDLKTLYMTPGGVTSGPGSLVHEMFLAAGLRNFQTQTGWHDLPLERLVKERPDMVAFASFDSHVTPWSSARHPIARQQLRDLSVVELEGAWTSCGGWFLVDAIEALAKGGPK